MRRFLSIAVLILIVFLGFFIYWNFYNSYSTGEREGKLFKFSLKGNVFKTYEAEMLLPGSRAGSTGFQNNFFYFSVTNDSIAKVLMNAEGKDITVHYTQYRMSLPWRGDNYNDKNSDKGQYIADQLISVKESTY